MSSSLQLGWALSVILFCIVSFLFILLITLSVKVGGVVFNLFHPPSAYDGSKVGDLHQESDRGAQYLKEE